MAGFGLSRVRPVETGGNPRLTRKRFGLGIVHGKGSVTPITAR
jgi:hypothetical protein